MFSAIAKGKLKMGIQASAVWQKDEAGKEDLNFNAMVPMDGLLDSLTGAPTEYKIPLDGSDNYEVTFTVKLSHKAV